MKVLVATSHTQGTRSHDFDHCVEGELVWIDEPCRRGRVDPDNSCGCARAFAGLMSHQATTTARIREVNFTPAEYVLALRTSLVDQGWLHETDVATDLLSRGLAGDLRDLAEEWPVGTVVERRLDVFAVRGADR